MHDCAFCSSPLHPLSEWRGGDGRFYCSEFCADAGDYRESRKQTPAQERGHQRAPRGQMMARPS